VCDDPQTQDYLQQVCDQIGVCQHYGSLSDRIQQQGLQHADSYVGSCHLQRELF
jgi:hypothetical protein